MSDLMKLECKGCGAPLRSIGRGHYVCEYCGSIYEREAPSIVDGPPELGPPKMICVYQTQKRIEKLGCEVLIPFEAEHYMSQDQIFEFVKHHMARKMADEVIKYTKIQVVREPIRMQQVFYGTVEVAAPN